MKNLNEITRMQQLAGINEITVNKPKYPYFDKWKKRIVDHLNDSLDYDGIDTNIFKKITHPEEAIEYLIDNEYLEDNDLDRDSNMNYIIKGEHFSDEYIEDNY